MISSKIDRGRETESRRHKERARQSDEQTNRQPDEHIQKHPSKERQPQMYSLSLTIILNIKSRVFRLSQAVLFVVLAAERPSNMQICLFVRFFLCFLFLVCFFACLLKFAWFSFASLWFFFFFFFILATLETATGYLRNCWLVDWLLNVPATC